MIAKNGRYAFVTGSSDRIGRAITLELLEMGYDLILHYRSSKEKTLELKNHIEQRGGKARLVQFDFQKENDYLAFFEELKRENLQLEVLINSASDFTPSGFEDKGNKLFETQIKSNFESAYQLTKAFSQVYNTGCIINLLDTKIVKNHSLHLDYLLSKKLLAEFTKLAAVHLAPGFRVNGICPGLILPPKDKDLSYLENLATNIPLKKVGCLEDIQRAVNYLVCSSFVTGQLLFIDGGEHLTC